MSTGKILVLIFIIALIGAIPAWPYSVGWGYYPMAIIGIILLFLIIFTKFKRP